jgi:replicative DNA helicase
VTNFLTPFYIAIQSFPNLLRRRATDPRYKGLVLPPGAITSALGRLRMSEVTILGGYPNHGKSALAQQIAFFAAQSFLPVNQEIEERKDGKKCGVLYCSMEMTTDQVISRAIAQQSVLNYGRLIEPDRLSDYEWPILEEECERIWEWPVILTDTCTLQTSDIRRSITDLSEEMDIRLVVVDYLQLLTDPIPKGGNDVNRLDDTVQALKTIARDFSCHVLALSSLNRAQGDGYLPSIYNVRGSGGIAFICDNGVILHMPRKFDQSLPPEWEDVAMLKVEKARNGPTGMYFLRWNKARLCFEDLSVSEIRSLPSLPNRRQRY